MDLGRICDAIRKSECWFDTTQEKSLWDAETISDVWAELPSRGQLAVYVTLPPNTGSLTLHGMAGEYFIRFFTCDSHYFCCCHSNISFFPPSTVTDQREPDSSICLRMTN